MTSEDEWEAAVAATTSAFGKLDVLVNNAGIAEAAPLAEMTLDSYRRVTEVNQTGVFLGMRAVVKAMTAAGGGSILNISSIDGLIGMDNIISYVASKWAVRGMTKTAARELAPRGIRVNSIHPAFIHTPMMEDTAIRLHGDVETGKAEFGKFHPIGHVGEPLDIANGVLYLASDESSFTTGAELVIDGGYTAA